MEKRGQHRGQYGHSSFPRGYVPDGSQRGVNPTSMHQLSRTSSLEGSDSFRQTQITTSQPATSAAMTVNANTQDMSSFGPYPAPQEYASSQFQGPASSFPYQPQYPQETARQQPFSQQYTSQLMYSVPQQQASTQSQYGSSSQYQPRGSVSAEVLSNDFNVPQFYSPGTAGSNSTPTAVTPQYPSAPYQPRIQYAPTADLESSTLVSPYSKIEPEATQAQPTNSTDVAQRQPDRYDVLYDQYRRALRETNENSSRGRLLQAGESLLEISDWLLGNAEGLGMSSGIYLYDDSNYRQNLPKTMERSAMIVLSSGKISIIAGLPSSHGR